MESSSEETQPDAERRVGERRKVGPRSPTKVRAAVAAGALSAVYLSLTSTAPFGWSFRSGLLGLALAWSVTTSMAIVAIRRRAFDQHRQWAIRSYVATFAFIFFRLAVVGMEALDFGAPAERYAVAAWLCWAVPLVVTEPLLQWRQIAGEARSGGLEIAGHPAPTLADGAGS